MDSADPLENVIKDKKEFEKKAETSRLSNEILNQFKTPGMEEAVIKVMQYAYLEKSYNSKKKEDIAKEITTFNNKFGIWKKKIFKIYQAYKKAQSFVHTLPDTNSFKIKLLKKSMQSKLDNIFFAITH